MSEELKTESLEMESVKGEDPMVKKLRGELLGKEIECRNLKEDLNDLRRKYLQVSFEKKKIAEAWDDAAVRIESIAQEMYIAVGNNANTPLVDI